ncbi:MAG TPA: peptidoglycan-associated lipoprotein Pal [Allosphingosinicella sp.]|jgi:peptidoglycan-associated lipoprotein|nr:peptidoglycan-associated lipoprotein Pal [Allosphingosinicella sp.]
MKTTSLSLIAASAALALTAGCAKKAPKEIPPPPMHGGEATQGNGEGAAGPGTGSVGQANLGGARADFLRNVASDRVFFGTDEYALDAQDRQTLDGQAAWLMAHPSVSVTIEGHCDERGTREYNLALGDRRANAVKDYLQAKGIPAARMTTISYGKERPVALGSNEEAWAQNRRAVTVVPQ